MSLVKKKFSPTPFAVVKIFNRKKMTKFIYTLKIFSYYSQKIYYGNFKINLHRYSHFNLLIVFNENQEIMIYNLQIYGTGV